MLITLFMFSSFTLNQQQNNSSEQDRSKIPEQYKWNLADLYKTEAEWRTDKSSFPDRFKKVETFEGKLGESGTMLYDALNYIFELNKDISKFYSYANMLSDEDTGASGPLEMKQEADQIYTDFSTSVAYVDPEILELSQEKLASFYKQEPNLETFRQYIDNIFRTKAHTLSQKEENIIAQAGLIEGNAANIYTVFKNAEIPRATVKLSDGKEVRLDDAAYSLYRASENRADRKKVFNAFFGSLEKFEMTFGTQLYGEVKEHVFNKNVRHYQSCLEAALDANNIPVEVYYELIKNTNKNLPTLYRYLNLRKRMLGVDTLHYYDIYAPLVKDIDLEYSYDEATKLVENALQILGDEYENTLEKAFKDRWIDVYPNKGKRSGAYSNGSAYDEHPYILLNYNGKYDDVSTLAHELGHTMHSYFSNEHQPYVNSQYPIFLAEVASTSNEALLMDYVLKKVQDPQEKLAILGNFLESCRGTLFRQAQFAEFELKIHQLAENGESLTGEKFSKIYLDLLKKYYGSDQGITKINDLYSIEWAYIPHFYYNFYVYQYSTSFTASQALAEKMLHGGKDMVHKYIDFLSSGRSEYAIPTLKKVGIDMTTDEPFNLAIQKMNRVMDEMEDILKQMGK